MICDVLAVGIGAQRSELRRPSSTLALRCPTRPGRRGRWRRPPRCGPEVELEFPRGGGGPGELVRPQLPGRAVRLGHRGEVDGLEDVRVELERLEAVVGQGQALEDVREPLDADADGAVLHVRVARLLEGVEVGVDDPVQRPRDPPHDLLELRKVEGPVAHVLGQADGGEVAHGDFVRRGVLDDLGAQVAALDGSEVLLVGLLVARVLVEHVREPGLHLRGQDAERMSCALTLRPRPSRS